MQSRIKSYSAIIIVLSVIYLSSCKEDPPTPAEQTQAKLQEIAGTYTVNSVNLDGNDVSDDYTEMTITLTSSREYSTGPNSYEPVWLSNGTFVFKDETRDPPVLTSFIRDDDIEVAYTLMESTMTFRFTVPNPFGKTAGIDGEYIFETTRQ